MPLRPFSDPLPGEIFFFCHLPVSLLLLQCLSNSLFTASGAVRITLLGNLPLSPGAVGCQVSLECQVGLLRNLNVL